jgi:hypothetical protein
MATTTTGKNTQKKPGRGNLANFGDKRGHGRPPGVPNKIPMSLKATVMEVFGRMGEKDGIDGKTALLKWACKNPESFYTRMIAPMLPKHIEINPEDHAKALGEMLARINPALGPALAEALDRLEEERALL